MRRIMVRPTPAQFDKKKIVAENRRARFDYHIEEVFEAAFASKWARGPRSAPARERQAASAA